MFRNHCFLMFWITNILCFPFPDYARMEVAGMKVWGFIIVCQPPPERALSLSELEEVEEKEEEEEEKEARKSFVTVINISPPINSCLHTHLTFKQCSDKTHIWKALNVTLDFFQMGFHHNIFWCGDKIKNLNVKSLTVTHFVSSMRFIQRWSTYKETFFAMV